MLTPSIGFCLMPSTICGALMPVASRIVGTMSMMWWNWLRTPPRSSMCPGHEMANPLPGAAEVRRDLLGPLKRRVERPRPGDRHMRVGRRRAPRVVKFHLVGDRDVEDSIVGSPLVWGTDQCAFGTGAVVADDVNDQSIVEFAHVFDLLN